MEKDISRKHQSKKKLELEKVITEIIKMDSIVNRVKTRLLEAYFKKMLRYI